MHFTFRIYTRTAQFYNDVNRLNDNRLIFYTLERTKVFELLEYGEEFVRHSEQVGRFDVVG